MTILSLFDGMSCGQLAFKRAGIKVDKYYASEVDKHAIKEAKANFPHTIHIGDVKHVDPKKYSDVSIIIGGSPCQNFSFSGKRNGMSTSSNEKIVTLERYIELKTKGFDFNGQSYLFWEYVRVLKEVKPKYFLLENVKMAKKWSDVISNVLGCEPVKVNSSLVSAQNRERLYWTNIPLSKIVDKDIKLINILENKDFPREPYQEPYRCNKPTNYKKDKFPTLRAQAGSKTRGIGVCNDKGWWRKLTPTECEVLQTVPKGYTNSVSDSQRYKMLGNGWTVDVIKSFFENIS